MPVISVGIMKTIDQREMQKKQTNKQTNKDRLEQGDRSYSERERAKWSCCEFQLGFLQLICKASLIFKLSL